MLQAASTSRLLNPIRVLLFSILTTMPVFEVDGTNNNMTLSSFS